MIFLWGKIWALYYTYSLIKRGMWRRGSDWWTTNTYHIRYVGSQKRFDKRDEFIQHCVSVQVVDPLDREWRRFLKYNKSFVYQSWLKSSQYIILWRKVVCIFISIYLSVLPMSWKQHANYSLWFGLSLTSINVQI